MRARWTWLELALITSIVALGAILRAWHVDGPSLWWDEVIHVGTAQQAGVWEVLRKVKLGSPPGSGNAGAVPLDYVLLHGWLRLVPMPEPRHLEAYFRAPALLWSALTPLALHLWSRRRFGPAAALAAAACLAFTTIHVAYGVEARFYALFALMTVANLAAFSWVLGSRCPLAWGAFAVLGVLYFLTGLFALLVLAVEYAALGADVLGRWSRRRRRPAEWRPGEMAFLVGSGALVALGPALYYRGTDLAVTARTTRPPIDVLAVSVDGLWTYASRSWVIAALLAVGLLVLVGRALRGRASAPLVATLVVLTLGILPAIAGIERWKLYYFHPRHGLFLTPVVALVVGVGAATLVARVVRGRTGLGLALAPLVVAVALGPGALAYLERAQSVLWLTKSYRTLEPVMEELAARLAAAPPRGKILLIAPLYGRASHMNPIIMRYLEWWGLTPRVVFRGAGIFSTALRRVREVCGESCRGRPGLAVEREIRALQAPSFLPPDARRLLGLRGRPGRWPGSVAAVVLLDYDNTHRVAGPLGYRGRAYPGLRTWHLPGDPPPPPGGPRLR